MTGCLLCLQPQYLGTAGCEYCRESKRDFLSRLTASPHDKQAIKKVPYQCGLCLRPSLIVPGGRCERGH